MTHKRKPAGQSGIMKTQVKTPVAQVTEVENAFAMEAPETEEAVSEEEPVVEQAAPAPASMGKWKAFWARAWALAKAKPAVAIPLLMLFALLLGLEVGFSLLGSGGAIGIFTPATWVHMFNLVFG